MSDVRPPKTPWNPSKKATARVKDPAPIPTECSYCAGPVSCVSNSQVYGREYGEWPWVYLCSSCGARTGLHPFTAIPLGTLADEPTRQARKSAKPVFEGIWRTGRMSRSDAYAWLAKRLGIPVSDCHFGLFDIDMCLRAKAVCSTEYKS